MNKTCSCIIIFFFFFQTSLFAFNLRKAGNTGISGSMINSVFQDKQGFIWFGTTIGACMYDGKNTTPLSRFKGVNNIAATVNGEIFAETPYGLKCLREKSDTVKTFETFNNISFSASDTKGSIFIVQGNGAIYYKAKNQNNFDNIYVHDLVCGNIKAFYIDHADILHIVTKDGVIRNFRILYRSDIVYLEESEAFDTLSSILFCFSDDENAYFVDNEYKLSVFSFYSRQTSFISDLKSELADKGKITSAAIFKKEFYFGTENGLFVLRENKVVRIPINKGVTCILKDKFQSLIWIGTAGDGLYTYSFDLYTIKTNLFSDFSMSASKPVAAVYYDPQGTLWLGTEGNGIIRIPNYNPDKEYADVSTLNVRNGLNDNTIYSFGKSKYGFWIGTKSGLAFYSNRRKEISNISTKDLLLRNVKDVYEQDSILWLACYGQGVVKAEIFYENENPRVKNVKLFTVNNGEEVANRFLSIYSANRNIWATSNGDGIFKLLEGNLLQYKFKNNDFNVVNKVAALNNEFIAATEFGLVKFNSDITYSSETVLLNNVSVKDILQTHRGDYWLSTDNGLVVYNSNLKTFRFFDDSYGLTVTEYLRGASFRDEQQGLLFLGGIDGFTSIRYNDYDEAMDYMPFLYPSKMTLFGVDRDLDEFKKEGSSELILNADQNFFSVTFGALDYINGNNYVYFYKIGKNGQWIDNGNSGTVSFTDVSPGNYDLFIKYHNKILNKESYTRRLSIRVLSPWYASEYAYLTYFILMILAVYLIVFSVSRRRKKQKEEEMLRAEQKRKEEIYEAKLDFFTDLAHEFCTPLTLIYGPCTRIMEQKSINPSVLQYAGVISQNAKRMNSLIVDLMDFKQIESGYKQPNIKSLDVSEIADKIIHSFTINSTGSMINISKNYQPNITWNSDEKFLITIMTNLLSNAVKYSDKDEDIKIDILREETSLKISISNRGKGIRKEDIDNIFSRYTILNNSEKQFGWRQNGLGLAVTSSMVKLLKGMIDVKSIPDEITTFTVTLPHMDETTIENTANYQIPDSDIKELIVPVTRYEYKDDRSTVTVIDDDPEMLWFICDLLNDEFNVIPISDPMRAVEALNQNYTDIILCDIMMKGVDGITLTKTLKSDKSISHIPLIVVSAIHQIEKQMEAIDVGAEMYVTKPFNPEYLKVTIRRLLGRKEDLKDYFASPLSTFELNMGKLQHAEHKKFVKKIYGIINKNIQNKDLSPNFIASELGMSIRSLYRKIKEITDIGLLEMIREGRLLFAENLLLKSKLTIDEIVFKSGFSNRASFYRAFSKKHSCNPTEFKERNGVS